MIISESEVQNSCGKGGNRSKARLSNFTAIHFWLTGHFWSKTRLFKRCRLWIWTQPQSPYVHRRVFLMCPPLFVSLVISKFPSFVFTVPSFLLTESFVFLRISITILLQSPAIGSYFACHTAEPDRCFY